MIRDKIFTLIEISTCLIIKQNYKSYFFFVYEYKLLFKIYFTDYGKILGMKTILIIASWKHSVFNLECAQILSKRFISDLLI